MNEQDKKLNGIRALVEAATPGPWTYKPKPDADGIGAMPFIVSDSSNWILATVQAFVGANKDNAALIAAAPEALTYTLDIIARQDARIEVLEAEKYAAEECIGFIAGCLSTISEAKAYIKPNTGVWHTVGLALEKIEQWREARFREGGGE